MEIPLSLELRDVALSRGERRLLAGLSFALRPGQLALVTGPNGSGKTTLLRSIAGLAAPQSGEILVRGKAVSRLDPAERGVIAYQAHLEGLKKDLTIEENILFFNKIRNISQPVSDLVQQLGLTPFLNRSVRHLSAGQKRRTVLAVLGLSGARIWLLDEPLTNLDPAGRELVTGWLDRHLASGGIAVVATHLAAALKRPGSLLVEL